MGASKARRPKAYPIQQNAPVFIRPSADPSVHAANDSKAGPQENESIQAKTDFFGNPVFFSPKNTVQARLKVGQPDDKFEKEADAVADKVVNGKGVHNVDSKGSPRLQPTSVQASDLQKKDDFQGGESLSDRRSGAEIEGEGSLQKM